MKLWVQQIPDDALVVLSAQGHLCATGQRINNTRGCKLSNQTSDNKAKVSRGRILLHAVYVSSSEVTSLPPSIVTLYVELKIQGSKDI